MSRKMMLALACALASVAMPGMAWAETVMGPNTVTLPDADAKITLPKGYAWAGKDEAKKALEKEGSSTEGIQGFIVPVEHDKNEWLVLVRWDDVGYVKDDDAAKLNADEILKSYKDGTTEQNEARKEKGIPPIYVGGWAEKPRYEKAKHQVVWAIQGKDEEAATAPVVTVNYNTRILGRRGVLSLNLVTDPDKVDINKSKVAALLDKTDFNNGAQYKDYVAGKDKASGFGIAGLILGGGAVAAAAKLGLLGGLWKWGIGIILVMKKFIIVLVAAAAAAINKFLKRGKKEDGSV